MNKFNTKPFYAESEWAELKETLVRRFTPLYSVNDKAHQIDHVIGVCDRAIEINERFGLGLDRRKIVISALSHDLFTWSRFNHHMLAEAYLLTAQEKWLEGWGFSDRQEMAWACLEHRASWTRDYSTQLSQLIATADRGVPGNLEEHVWRCYLYGRDNLKQSHQEALERVIPHLVEKLCTKGYGKNPPLYTTVYGALIDQQIEQVKALTLNHPLLQKVEGQYNAITNA